MELHNALNNFRKYYTKKGYLIEDDLSYDRIKEFSFLYQIKSIFSPCPSIEDVLCNFIYVINPPCADVVTAVCDYAITGQNHTYNIQTETLNGYFIFTGNMYTDVSFSVNKYDLTTSLPITIGADGVSTITKRLNYTFPLNIEDYFDNSFVVSFNIESDKCAYYTPLSARINKLQVNKDPDKIVLSGKPLDLLVDKFVIDIPIMVLNAYSYT